MSSVEAFSGAVALSSYDAFAATDQAALDALPVAICLCSADGTIVRFNRRAVELWGRTPRPGDAHDTLCRLGPAFTGWTVKSCRMPQIQWKPRCAPASRNTTRSW